MLLAMTNPDQIGQAVHAALSDLWEDEVLPEVQRIRKELRKTREQADKQMHDLTLEVQELSARIDIEKMAKRSSS